MSEPMEHPRIDDEKILDRYLVGRLAEEDEALFEEHLFACADCLEQVRAGEDLRRGLRAAAAEDAARVTVSLGLLAWLRGRSPAQRAGLAALALIVALLPAALVWQQVELGRLREVVAVGTGGTGLAEPLGDFLVVSLGAVRDVDGADPVEIRPDAGRAAALLLSLELPTVEAARYRVTLRDDVGTLLWRGDDLEPTLYDTLLVALPASYLAPGEYRVVVEALGPSGVEPAGEMAFRIASER